MTPGQFTIMTVADMMANTQMQLELSIAQESDPVVCTALLAMLRQVTQMRTQSVANALGFVQSPAARAEMKHAANAQLPTVQ